MYLDRERMMRMGKRLSIILSVLVCAFAITAHAESYMTGTEAAVAILEHNGIDDSVDVDTVMDGLGINDGSLTREDAIKAIIRSYGVYPAGEDNHIWADELEQDRDAKAYIDYGYRIGITCGTGGNCFSPKDYVTQEQFYMMLDRADEVGISPLYNMEYDTPLCKVLSSDVQKGVSRLPECLVDRYVQYGGKVIVTTHPIICNGYKQSEDWVGCINYKHNTIWVAAYTENGCRHVVSTTIHEFGHFLEYCTKPIDRYRIPDELERLIAWTGDYCDTDNSEYFARAFEKYVTMPILSRVRLPETYEHITLCIEMMDKDGDE